MILFPIRCLYALYLVLFVERLTTDHDVITYILNSTLALLVKAKPDDKNAHRANNSYVIHVSRCLIDMKRRSFWPLFEPDDDDDDENEDQPQKKSMMMMMKKKKSLSSFTITSFRIEFQVDQKHQQHKIRLCEVTVNGHMFSTTEPRVILSILWCYHIFSLHTKSHVMSHFFLRQVEVESKKPLSENKYAALLPDILATTDALHHALLCSPFSVLEHAHSSAWNPLISNTRDALTEESCNWSDFSHSGLTLLQPYSPFLTFLAAARNILRQELVNVGIEDQFTLDMLFSHTILHAVDHVVAQTTLHGIHLSLLPDDFSILTRWRSRTFSLHITAPTLHPWYSNLISHSANPFFQNLFSKLSSVDADLANVVTASIMY